MFPSLQVSNIGLCSIGTCAQCTKSWLNLRKCSRRLVFTLKLIVETVPTSLPTCHVCCVSMLTRVAVRQQDIARFHTLVETVLTCDPALHARSHSLRPRRELQLLLKSKIGRSRSQLSVAGRAERAGTYRTLKLQSLSGSLKLFNGRQPLRVLL